MKTKVLLMLTLLLVGLLPARAQGSVVTVDGLTYKISNGEAALVWGPEVRNPETGKLNDPVEKVVIPEKVAGCYVKTINFNPYCDTLVIPKTVKTIDVKASYNGKENPNYPSGEGEEMYGAQFIDSKVENPGTTFKIYDLFSAIAKSADWYDGSVHSWLKVPEGYEGFYPEISSSYSFPVMIYSEEKENNGVIVRVNWYDFTAIISGYTSEFATGPGVTYSIPQDFYDRDFHCFTVVGIDVCPDVGTVILPQDATHKMKFLRVASPANKTLIIPEGLQNLYVPFDNSPMARLVCTPNLSIGPYTELFANEIWFYGTGNQFADTFYGQFVGLRNADVLYVPSAEVTRFKELLEDYTICPFTDDHLTIDSWLYGFIFELYTYTTEGEDQKTAAKVTGYRGTIPETLCFPSEYNGYNVRGIDDHLFSDNTAIKSVILPYSLLDIGSSAFEGCTSLQQVISLASDEVTIGNSAFKNCTALQEVKAPCNPPTKFLSQSFYYTTSLSSVQLFAKSYGEEAFAYSGIEYLPEQFMPEGMTIGDGAFEYSQVEEVRLFCESGLLSIGKGAFAGCGKLSDVQLTGTDETEGRIEIGELAFSGCSNLAAFMVEMNPKSIGNRAFYNCSKLKYIDLNPTPDAATTTTLGKFLFEGCNQLVTINFPSKISLPEVGTIIAHNKLNSLELVNLPKSWNGVARFGDGVPATVTLISPAYFPSRLEDMSFSEEAFQGATVIIPNGALDAYKDCTGWKEFVNLGEDDEVYPKIYVNDVEYTLDLFESTAQVTGFREHLLYTVEHSEGETEDVYNIHDHITLEPSVLWNDATFQVNSIADEAFKDCHILKKLTIPEAYTVIGKNAFTGSTLEEVVINAHLQQRISYTETQSYSESNGPFNGCESLTKATLGPQPDSYPYSTTLFDHFFCGATSLKDIILPEGLKEIGTGAFMNTAVEEIQLPSTLHGLGDKAFKSSKLKKLIVPDNVQYFYGTGWFEDTPIEEIYLSASLVMCPNLSDLSSLKKVEISENVTWTKLWGFRGLPQLEEVILPPSVKTIQNNCFSGCTSLKNVYMPEGLEVIESAAFSDCTSLEEIHFPSTLKEIGFGAFRHTGLKELVLPENLEKIGAQAFFQNTNTSNGYYQTLEHVICLATVPPTRTDFIVKEQTGGDLIMPTLYVPEGCQEAYSTAWGDEWGNISPFPGSEYMVYGADKTTPRGATVKMPISLFNLGEVTGLMIDMTLPEGVRLVQNSNGDYAAQLTDRTTDHQLIISDLPNGDYRFIIISFGGQNISGNGGDLFTMSLDLPTSLSQGDYEIGIKVVSLNAPDGTEIVISRPMSKPSTLTLTDKLMGDVNMNKLVKLDDAISIINYVNHRPPSKFDEEVADLNDDGQITLADVIKLIQVLKYIIYDSPAKPATDNTSLRIQRTIDGFDVCLDNVQDYTALTFEMSLPEGSKVEGVAADAARCGTHQVETSLLADGTTRVILYSMAGTPLKGGSGRLLHVTTDVPPVDVTLDHIDVVTPLAEAYSLTAVNGYATGIAPLRGGMAVGTSGSAFVITSDKATEVTICAADGRVLRQATLTAGTHTLGGFAPGVYLVNDVKYTIK